MSGNLYFSKSPEPFYELVFDYVNVLVPGETVKDFDVYVNSGLITGDYNSRLELYNNGSGIYDSIFTMDPYQYDNNTVLLTVTSGIIGSGYTVEMQARTNRNNIYSKTIDVFIDELAYPTVYHEFQYRFLVDENRVYILPAMYVIEDVLYPGFWYNTEYTVNVSKELISKSNLQPETNESFWFTSKYCPMFTSATRIKLQLGPEGDKFTEDTINRYIHRTSMEVVDFINLSPSCAGKRIPYNYYGCDDSNIPINFRRYVECKVAYDLYNILDRMRLVNGMVGGQTKKLGDMTISYGSTAGMNSCACGPKKDLYDCFMGLRNIISNTPTLCGTGAGISNAVRGWFDNSKGFPHPTMDRTHNRISKPKPNADGPWYNTTNYRYPMSVRKPLPPRRRF